MYRLLITLLVPAMAAGAPQESNRSEETYVKIEPVNETTFQNIKPDISNQVKNLQNDFDRRILSDGDEVTTEIASEPTTETGASATEVDERSDPVAGPVDDIKTRTKTPSPRFHSKLSYFQKLDYMSGPSPTNNLERYTKKRFKSRCRCEKIWNCPKLQITVPRCPDEYFLCCF